MSDARLLGVLFLELLMALCWIPVLKRRGWGMRHVSPPGATGDVLVGAGIAIYAYFAYWLTFMIASSLSPRLASAAIDAGVGGGVSLGVALLVSVANPIAEEFLYLGFVVNALRKEGMPLALSVSVLLRVLVHLYQGPLAFLAILPVGLVLTAYYAQARRIWPAVFAHGFMDLVALGRLVK